MSDLRVFTDDSLRLFCSSGHTWRVIGYDVGAGLITEKCSRCDFRQERKAMFSRAAKEREARHQSKIDRDARRRFDGKLHQSKRKGAHPATRKR